MRPFWTVLALSAILLSYHAQADDVIPSSSTGNHPYTDSPSHAEPLTATEKIVTRFMTLDTDESNTVSFDEYMTMVQERTQARFAIMDGNGDGEVTDREYRKFWKKRKAQWYRPKR